MLRLSELKNALQLKERYGSGREEDSPTPPIDIKRESKGPYAKPYEQVVDAETGAISYQRR